MNQKLLSVVLFGTIVLPFGAYAATDSLDEVVVTASRVSQPLDKTIAHTTVLNEQAIRQSGAADVESLLRSMAGIEVTQNGGLGKQSSILMRGTNSTHVLVLLDGVRIGSATTGATALDQIMLDGIERIEVVRGNVSSMYGSEAIGGVIQLFTKRGHGAPGLNASVGLGSLGTQRLAAGFSGEVNDSSFSVQVGNVKTNGVSAINPLLVPAANPNRNGYDNTTLNAQLNHAFNADHMLTATLFSTRGKGSYDSAFGLPTDINDALTSVDKFSLAMDNQLSEKWHSSLRASQGTDENRSYTNGIQLFRFLTRSKQLVWQNEIKLADTQHLNLAVEHLGQAVSSSTVFTQNSRNVNSLLAGYVGDYGVHQVQANVRQDRYASFGTINTGLLGYGLQFADAWRLTASIANAFKAPTINDLYYPLTWGFSGNPNLRPERAQNKEVALRYAAKDQRLDIVYFNNRIRDLISVNNTFTSMTNVGEAKIDGLELSYAGSFDGTRVKADLAFQNPRDATTGTVLLKRAKEFATLGVAHDFDNWSAGVELRHSGARQDFGAKTLTSYQLLNLSASYRMAAGLNLTARLDNVTNRDYAETYGYNTLGRTLFVSLSYLQ
ncbi:MAG: TonB-dependent receptor [Gallionella sp.]|nr:TonB-dependent receptor [Gallionella sp.]MDD4947094.1 TonB-dependent receptor [Gallionella sp.]